MGRSVDLALERRQALITAAVTGDLDVAGTTRRQITSTDIESFVAATEDLRNPELMAKAWD